MSTAKDVGKETIIGNLVNEGLDAVKVDRLVNLKWNEWSKYKLNIFENKIKRELGSGAKYMIPIGVLDHWGQGGFQEKSWIYALGRDPQTRDPSIMCFWCEAKNPETDEAIAPTEEHIELGKYTDIAGSRWTGEQNGILKFSADMDNITKHHVAPEDEIYSFAKAIIIPQKELQAWMEKHDQHKTDKKKQKKYNIIAIEGSFGTPYAARDFVESKTEFKKDKAGNFLKDKDGKKIPKIDAIPNEAGFVYADEDEEGRFGPHFQFNIMPKEPLKDFAIRVLVRPQIAGDIGLLVLGEGEWEDIDEADDKLTEFKGALGGLPAVFFLQTQAWDYWNGKVTLNCDLIAAINWSRFVVGIPEFEESNGVKEEPKKSSKAGDCPTCGVHFKDLSRHKCKGKPKKEITRKEESTAPAWVTDNLIETLQGNKWNIDYEGMEYLWEQIGNEEKDIPTKEEFDAYLEANRPDVD